MATLPPEVDAVAYFASRREADADGNRFLAAVVPQLEYILAENPGIADRHRLGALWYRATQRAQVADRPLLLVVDGLDEDLHPLNVPSIASLLPTSLGSRGHVLVTSRPHPDKPPSDVDEAHPLRVTRQVALLPSKEASRLAIRAHQELQDLLRGDYGGLALEVIGVLTAAAGRSR